MGRKKWKAKKLEKKMKKNNANLPQEKKVKSFYAGNRNSSDSKLLDTEIDLKNATDEQLDSEDEMAAAKKQAASKAKKKSGGFQSMSLSHAVLKGILRRGYKIPTPIQRKTIPLILEGKDIVAMARTGSGKTAAFLVPMFERLKSHSTAGIRAMILSPTRELAVQTLKFTKEIGKFTGLKAAVVLGGDRMDDQFAALHDHPDIIIATPGRLLHVLVEMGMKLKAVEYIVFDEADRLFEMGFQDQLREIIHRLPEARQTLLFSATLPKSLVEFARAGLTDPTLIRLDVDTKLSENLKLAFFSCRDEDKCAMLLYLLKHVIKPTEQTVVFAATKHHVEFLNLLLTLCGLSVTYIYSSLDPAARKINASKFSLGKVKVLLVTDLAARGIDVPLLDNVINFHFPAKAKLFVHRVGRVARAGRSGVAYSLVAPDEMSHFVDLHIFLGHPVKMVPLAEKVEDQDGWFGEVPQSLLDDENAEVMHIVKATVELTGLLKVCSNAYKKYSKSRPAAASESVKRSREMVRTGVKIGIHPLFNSVDVEEKGDRLNMLNALKNYKPKTTIFEINSTSKKAGLAVMKAKRDQHEHIILSNMAKKKEDTTAGSEFTVSTTGHKRKISDEADEDKIKATFNQVVSSRSKLPKPDEPPAKKKKKLPSSDEIKDKENYIEYRPSDFASERGLNIGNSFDRQASGAVLDFTNEEDEKPNKSKRHWDRKKKKFVTDHGPEQKKKIKTESGNWISASYKSNAYHEWKRRTHFNDRDDEDEDIGGGHKRSLSSAKAHGDGKFSIVGMKNKRWHTKGNSKDNEVSNRQNKRKFQKGGNMRGELRSADQILKDRQRKSKIQNFQKHRQNIRAKRQGKVNSSKGGRKGKK